mgnify:CR=1 FL=1
MTGWRHAFTRFAKNAASLAGHPATFAGAAALIVIWAASGPLFGFSDTWQLVVNTTTTIITFLMVFVIQNTQNRDTEAIQIKLDELIKVTSKANNALLKLDEMDADELARIKADYQASAKAGRSGSRGAKTLAKKARKTGPGGRRRSATTAD